MKKVWDVIWDVTSIYPLVCGIIGVGAAFSSYKMYTVLSYATSGWQTFWLWIKIVFFVIMALVFIVASIVLIFELLGDIADAIKYDDKKDGKNNDL